MEKKRKIFLSFRPEFFRPILYDIKKYEYRKRFTDQETLCYLYLSSKSKCIVGVLKLGKPIRLDKERDKFIDNPKTLKLSQITNKKSS